MFRILSVLVVALSAAMAQANEFHKPHVLDLKGKAFEEKVRARGSRLS
jgi:hypothetical protein